MRWSDEDESTVLQQNTNTAIKSLSAHNLLADNLLEMNPPGIWVTM